MIIEVKNNKCQIIEGGSDFLKNTTPIEVVRDYLKIQVKNYFRTKAFKEGRWDGYSYYCTPKGKFPTGFLPKVIKLLEHDFDLSLYDMRENKIDSNYLVEDIKVWKLRPNQKDCVENCLNNYLKDSFYFPRGIVDGATNAGKNSIMSSLYFSYNQPNTLMLIHSRDIFNQAIEFFSQITDIGYVGEGKIKIGNFTIAMYKTLLNRSKSINIKKYLKSVQLLFIDETHRAGSKEYSKLVSMIDAFARFGVSGTPLDRSDQQSNLITIGLTGSILHKIENKELIDSDYSSKPIVNIIRNPLQGPNYLTYSDAYEFGIVKSIFRNSFIKDYSRKNPNNYILTSVNFKEHGDFISHYSGGKTLFADSEFRDEIFQDFSNKKINHLITTLLREGVNIPHLNDLILAQGGKAIIPIKQLIGRLIRKGKHKSVVNIYDWYDFGKFIEDHSKKRIELYEREKFEIRIIDTPIIDPDFIIPTKIIYGN